MSSCPASATFPAAEPLERRVLFAANVLDVVVGDGGSRSVTFTDSDGTAASVSIRRGTATVRFTGEGLAQAPVGRAVAVSGSGVAVAAVTASGTSRHTILAFTASGGDERLTVGLVSTDGPVKAINGRNVVLTGGLGTGGIARRVELLRTENATISLGGGAGMAAVTIHEAAVDTDLTSVAPVRHLRLTSWTGLDAGDTITAPAITSVTADLFSGDFVTGSIKSLDIDQVRGATISVSGSMGQMRVQSARDLFVNVVGDINSATFGLMTNTRVYAGVGPLTAGSAAPSSPADFVEDSTIRRFSLLDAEAAPDSIVAARLLSNLKLRGVAGSRAPGTFFVADRIQGGVATVVPVSGKPAQRARIATLDQGDRSLGSVLLRAL